MKARKPVAMLQMDVEQEQVTSTTHHWSRIHREPSECLHNVKATEVNLPDLGCQQKVPIYCSKPIKV